MKILQDSIITIDKRSNDSFAIQISDQIRNLILTHKFNPIMTNVSYIANLCEVDRKDVLDAFKILREDQIYDIEDDNETYFVNYQEVATVDNKIVYAIADVIKELNQEFIVKVISKEVFKPTDEAVNSKGFKKSCDIFKQRRIYLGDSNPKAYIELYLSKEFYPDIEDDKYQEMPYYEIIDLKANANNMIRERILRAIKLPDQISSYLGQSSNSVGFHSQEHYYNHNKELMLFVDMYMNLNYFVRLKE